MKAAFKPKKKLGQNFLRSAKVLQRICDAAFVSSSDEVFEIGPGGGELTRFILKKKPKVLAVEKDRALVENFPADLISDKNLKLIQGDATEIDIKKLFPRAGLKLVSNLPYGISSAVLRMLTESRELFSLAVIMLQKEVALRVVAPAGSRASGSLSLTVQMFFDAEKLFDVPPSFFTPRPAVASSVVRLTPLKSPRFPLTSEEFYIKTVRAAFSVRRKMIKNSLCSVFPKTLIDRALRLSSVDGAARAENLSLEEFSVISDKLYRLLGEKN